MARGAILLLLAFALQGSLSSGAEKPPAQSFQVEVNLVVIDVVVTDKDGNHVRGLKKEDFELLEDGKPQEITDFSEEGLPLTTEAEMERDLAAVQDPKSEEAYEGRWFVLLFDESNMTGTDLTRARQAARDFVRYDIFPKDRVAILRYGGSLELRQDFTGDSDRLSRALYEEGTKGWPLQKNVTEATGTPARDEEGGSSSATFGTQGAEARGQSDVIRFQDSPDIAALEKAQANQRLYKALSLVGKTLARIHGRKTLVFFSGGFDAVFADHGLFRDYREMVNTLNSANVAIYPVDPGGLKGKTPGQADVGGRSGSRINQGPSDAFRGLAQSQLSSLHILAADTGGQAMVSGNDIGRQLKKMAYSTSSYYMLGYTPAAEVKEKGFRDIKVKVKRPGAKVLARKGYYQAAQFAEMSKGEKKQELEDALVSWVDVGDLPIQLRAEFYPTGNASCVLGMEVGVARGLLATDEAGARAEILLYLRHENGKDVAKTRETVSVGAADSTKDLRYVKGFSVPSGSYWLKAVVRDGVKGTMGTAGVHLTIPEFEADRPIMSSLVLMTPDSGSKLVRSTEGEGEATASFQVAGQQYSPSTDNAFPAQGELLCFFRVSNLKLDDATHLPRLTVRYTVFRGSEPISQQTVHYKMAEGPDPKLGLPIYVRLPVGNLGGGSYKLEVSVYDILAAKGIKADVPFTLVPQAAQGRAGS